MNLQRIFAGSAIAALIAAGSVMVATPASAAPGFIALEGSDATSFHHDGSYSTQLFKYLKGTSAKKVLIYNPSGTINIDATTGLTNAYTTTLTGVTLTDYSALYLQTPGSCCSASLTALDTFGSSVNAFIGLGGNLAIGDYRGGGYDGVVIGGAAAPAGVIEGFTALNGGVGGGPSCTDRETVTLAGISKGFSQPPVLGCWSHQAYDNTYWGALGYLDLIHADPAYTFRGGGHNGSSFLAIGGSLGSPGIPEPATWAMLVLGFGGVGALVRNRRRMAVSVA